MWIDRRVLVATTAASLLLNVFLGGAVLGRLLGEHRTAATGSRGAFNPLVRPGRVLELPEDERRQFRMTMAMHHPSIRAAREAHRAARRRIEAAIAAPTFDAAALADDFQLLRQTAGKTEEVVDAALIEALAKLKPESRAGLVAGVRGVGPAAKQP